MVFQKHMVHTLLGLIGIAFASLACAHGAEQQTQLHQLPPSLSVNGESAQLAPDTTDLKFRDFYKMPIGPRGLEPTEKLLSLNGKRVRIVGYMAHAETPMPGVFILSPLPVDLGDEDESLSDDLPPSALFVHMDAENLVVPHIPGLIRLTGILNIGSQDEADGHVSLTRLQLDPAITADLARALAKPQASN